MEKGELLVSGPQGGGPELGGPESQQPISDLSIQVVASDPKAGAQIVEPRAWGPREPATDFGSGYSCTS